MNDYEAPAISTPSEQGSKFLPLSQRYARMKQVRQIYQDQWESIRKLVRPNVPDFFSSNLNPDQRRTQRIYDGTAPWALEQLASGLHSFNVSSAERWFSLQLTDIPPDEVDDDVALWLESTASKIYQEFQRPSSGFNSSMHEVFLDLSGFGTGAIFEYYSTKSKSLVFRTYPLADCWFEESSDGRIDVCFRRTKMNLRQILQEFPNLPVGSRLRQAGMKGPEKVFEIIHGVFPRTDRDSQKPDISNNKKFASFFFNEEFNEVLHEGGYDMFPYHVPRWTKLAGEVYGSSPAGSCLPDIQMVNQMVRTIIVAAQKASDPPVVMPNSGFMVPIRTSPGSVIYKEPGTESAEPFPYVGQPEFGLELINSHRQQITRAFYIEHLLRERKKERQSMMEIQDERMEMLQQLGPVFGRINSELLGPTIALSAHLLMKHKRIEPPPVANLSIRPFYTSPAARAQLTQKSIGIRRFVEEIVPMANIDPSVLDSINIPEVLRLSVAYEDISPKVIRSPEEIQQIQQQREEKEQEQHQAEVAGPMAKAAKDMAQAQAI